MFVFCGVWTVIEVKNVVIVKSINHYYHYYVHIRYKRYGMFEGNVCFDTDYQFGFYTSPPLPGNVLYINVLLEYLQPTQ